MKMKNGSGLGHIYNEKLVAHGECIDIANCDLQSMKALGFVSEDSNEIKTEAPASTEEGK